MAYQPDAIPEDTPPALKAWLADQLRRIAAEMGAGVQAPTVGAEPARPRRGQVVYAVAPWATSLGGEGVYGYESGSWVKL